MAIQTKLAPMLLMSVVACGRADGTHTTADFLSNNAAEPVVTLVQSLPADVLTTASDVPDPSKASHTQTSTPVTPSRPPPTNTEAPSTETIVTSTSVVAGAIRYVISADESLVSYGVGETFLNQNNRYNYAVGVTNAISGEIMVDPYNPSLSSVGTITVDISTFQSDKARRDKAILGDWLESARYPMAEFSPSKLLAVADNYSDGETLSFEMVGSLQVRGVSNETTFTVTALLEGESLMGTATTRVQMTDFGFNPPSIAGILEAENDVDLTLEFVALPAKP